MEVLNPVDLSFMADKMKYEADNYVEQVKGKIKSVLPIGYSISKKDKWILIARTEDIKDKESSFWSNFLGYKHAREICLKKEMTAVDLYKLCGILQILIQVNIENLPNFNIIN